MVLRRSGFQLPGWDHVAWVQSVKDSSWQIVRGSMKNTLKSKHETLENQLEKNVHSKKPKAQTQCHVKTLHQSGLIK